MSNLLLQAALHYADMGYQVFPCWPGTKKPIPIHGHLDATTDTAQIEKWWLTHPKANVAIRTEGLIVIDVDDNGQHWMGDQDERWQDLAFAPSQTTPRGGRHYYFKRLPNKSWRCTQSELAAKVDTRTNGGYVVVAPSVTEDGRYQWCTGYELEVSPDKLPLPPQWLIEQLDALTAHSKTAEPESPSGDAIVQGKRNATLTSLAGTMRRAGMHEPEIAAALHKVNSNRCQPPLDLDEVNKIAKSVARYAPYPEPIKQPENPTSPQSQAAPISVADLIGRHPNLRDPVIHGLLRRGETMNIIAPSKTGKSWLVNDLAFALASGVPWLGTFGTEVGEVLILDNELHAETSASRFARIATARGLEMAYVQNHVYVQNLRGKLKDLDTLGPYFHSLQKGRFKIIILDAFYRFMPRGMDENDNGTMAGLYNQLDLHADRLDCCFVLIHHSTKGSQSGRAITDVGAGAGAQSRAADTHLILRNHQEPGVVVLEAVVRSWVPLQPLCLKWEFPVWSPAPNLDPTALKPEKTLRAKKPKEPAPPKEVWTVHKFVSALFTKAPLSQDVILGRATQTHFIPGRTAKSLLTLAEADKLIHRWRYAKDRTVYFATVEQSLLDTQ